ncbi:hypothetical protein HK097_008337 [Rhizophlyctis rosea]|uniref:Uncharacterized protein n=1 Tax=Rhizophlyctis rosea TaxID=64517 RepID=A0AAD5SCM8_9FUNG|nr:hypothetical protein HK097_008337 [Rhizophlyctis rosea]
MTTEKRNIPRATLTMKSKKRMEERERQILESDTKEEIDGVESIHETIESDDEVVAPEKMFYFRKDYKCKDQVMEWALQQYKTNQCKCPGLTKYVERLDENAHINQFVDFDMSWKSEDKLPTKGTQNEIFEHVIDTFERSASKVKKNEETSKYDMEAGKVKISSRLWTSGLTSTPKIMKTKLTDYLPDMSMFPEIMKNYDLGTSFFDVCVYNKDRKMCCLNKTKLPEDTRILERCNCDDTPLEDYLIQNVHNTDEEAKWAIADGKLEKTVKNKGKEAVADEGTSTIDNKPEKTIFECVTKSSPDAYLQRNLAEPTKFDKCINVFVKSPYCIIAESEHTASVNKMYFVVGSKYIKYKCAECNKESNDEHKNAKIAQLFASKKDTVTPELLCCNEQPKPPVNGTIAAIHDWRNVDK